MLLATVLTVKSCSQKSLVDLYIHFFRHHIFPCWFLFGPFHLNALGVH